MKKSYLESLKGGFRDFDYYSVILLSLYYVLAANTGLHKLTSDLYFYFFIFFLLILLWENAL